MCSGAQGPPLPPPRGPGPSAVLPLEAALRAAAAAAAARKAAPESKPFAAAASADEAAAKGKAAAGTPSGAGAIDVEQPRSAQPASAAPSASAVLSAALLEAGKADVKAEAPPASGPQDAVADEDNEGIAEGLAAAEALYAAAREVPSQPVEMKAAPRAASVTAPASDHVACEFSLLSKSTTNIAWFRLPPLCSVCFHSNLR